EVAAETAAAHRLAASALAALRHVPVVALAPPAGRAAVAGRRVDLGEHLVVRADADMEAARRHAGFGDADLPQPVHALRRIGEHRQRQLKEGQQGKGGDGAHDRRSSWGNGAIGARCAPGRYALDQFSRREPAAMIEALLLTTVPVGTYAGEQPLTNASGFFFERDGRLFLVTSRHVLHDEATAHRPDRVVIDLHTDAGNIASAT